MYESNTKSNRTAPLFAQAFPLAQMTFKSHRSENYQKFNIPISC